MPTSTCKPPVDPPRAQQSVASRLAARAPAAEHHASRTESREHRLDRIEAAKSKLWLNSLRLTELVYFCVIGGAVGFVYSQNWLPWATAIAASASIVGMWLFSRRMSAREERLRRMIDLLARRRRTCAECGYRLQDLGGDRCPECGLRFDPDDKRPFLAQQTLVMFSGQARMVSAVMIVFVLFWVSILARGGDWLLYGVMASGLLLALNGVYFIWAVQVRRSQRAAAQKQTRTCRHCENALHHDAACPPKQCPACSERLTYSDIFIRPDVRRMADRRIRRLVYASLMLRWVFFLALFGGLLALVQFDVAMRFFASLGFSRSLSTIGMLALVLAWMLGVAVAFRQIGRAIQRRLRRLFSAIAPHCRRCGNELSETPVGEPCPNCRATPSNADLLG